MTNIKWKNTMTALQKNFQDNDLKHPCAVEATFFKCGENFLREKEIVPD